jgi:hypothetical protein
MVLSIEGATSRPKESQMIKQKKLAKIIKKAEKKAAKIAAKKGKKSNTKVERSDVSLI